MLFLTGMYISDLHTLKLNTFAYIFVREAQTYSLQRQVLNVSLSSQRDVMSYLQSVANIVYALGKLKHPLPPSTCKRVENLVTAESGQAFRDVEAANILYGFVRTSYQAPNLVQLLEKR